MAKPVVHFEFWSKDPDKTSAFYKEVFDWEIQSMPEMHYHLIQPAGEGSIGGGIMKPQDGPMPGNMALYIDVEDLAPYRDKVVAAGGSILVEEMEIPGVGKFCLFMDPDGRANGMWWQDPNACKPEE